MAAAEFESFLAEGLSIDVEAFWGAGFLDGRYVAGQPSWQWRELAGPLLAGSRSLLDMGTGDGGVLAGLQPLPELTVAYEEWLPTVPRAVETLGPLGVRLVVALGSDDNTADQRTRPGLPFADGSFHLVLNRHEAFDAVDVRRCTTSGGHFLTQQVGSGEASTVRALLGLPAAPAYWGLDRACGQLREAGWTIIDGREERPVAGFADIGALVAYIRTTPWAFADALACEDPWSPGGPLVAALRRLHVRRLTSPVEAVGHRFWVLTRKP